MRPLLSIVLPIGLLSWSATGATAQRTYEVVRMPEVYAATTLNNRPVSASALNEKHRVTGVVIQDIGGQSRAIPFAWSKSDGAVFMAVPRGHTGASAGAIDDAGKVAGFVTHPSTGMQTYIWKAAEGGERKYEFIAGLENRIPYAYNGQIMAGGPAFSGAGAWAYDSRTRQVHELTVGGNVVEGINRANAVNSSGEVVGTISTVLHNGNVSPRAFRWSLTRQEDLGGGLELLEVPPSEWLWSDASGINDHGDIVGFLFDLVDISAAFWDGQTGAFTDLGLAPGELRTEAKAINTKGEIVGWSPNDHPNGLDTPFVWTEGAFYNLNHLLATPLPFGDVVYRAWDINDSGVILAEIFQPFNSIRFEQVLLVPRLAPGT